MSTIDSVLHRLLPAGPNGAPKWWQCPGWPPDAFAVAATLVELAGSYAKADAACRWRGSGGFDFAYRERVRKQADEWVRELWPSDATNQLWKVIWKNRKQIVGRPSGLSCEPWEMAALELLAVADEASAGMGFEPMFRTPITADELPPPPSSGKTPSPGASFFNDILFHEMVYRQELRELQEAGGAAGTPSVTSQGLLPFLPNSICNNVPPEVACVQPKTNTPRVGCTLRSLSHHLALLPGRGIVETVWRYGIDTGSALRERDAQVRVPLNVLLLPVPYELHGESFAVAGMSDDKKHGYFELVQNWLKGSNGKLLSDEVAEWTGQMIEAAKRDVGTVHAVVFPEGALDRSTFEKVGTHLAEKFPALELLISGVMQEDNGVQRNIAATMRFDSGEGVVHWNQSKHHRWRLNPAQVRAYHLGHALSPNFDWWEAIDISRRRCTFTVVRPWASLAVLICEDLARVDPVLPAINAIGPTLLVALLMDGAQLETRWSARYASVLADDPGCSVLTFTSRGAIGRSRPMHMSDNGRHPVALWKEPDGNAQPLFLEPGSQGLVLSLVTKDQEQYTMDGRSDFGMAQVFALGGAVAVYGPAFPRCPKTITVQEPAISGGP